MIFKGGICSKRFFAHYTLLCPCVLVFDMSTVGAWCQNFLTNIASFLFDYLRLHLIFSLVCNIDGRPPRCAVGAGLGDLWMEICSFNCSGVPLKVHFGQLEAILMLLDEEMSLVKVCAL